MTHCTFGMSCNKIGSVTAVFSHTTCELKAFFRSRDGKTGADACVCVRSFSSIADLVGSFYSGQTDVRDDDSSTTRLLPVSGILISVLRVL